MFYFFLGLILLLTWYLTGKGLKERFHAWLKWPALALIMLIMFVDVFFFVETDRLIAAHECCQSCNETGIGECEQCCLSMNVPEGCYTNSTNILIDTGTWNSGTAESLAAADNDYYSIQADIKNDIIFYANYSCPNADMIWFKGNSDLENNIISIYDGTNWQDIYAFDDAGEYNVHVPTQGYNNNGTIMLKIRSSSIEQGTFLLNIDMLKLTYSQPVKAYCTDSADTTLIFSHHYSQYAILPLFLELLNPMIMFVVGGAVLLYIYVYIIKPGRIDENGMEVKEKDADGGK